MTKFDKFLQDDQIGYLLKEPALQFHLLSIITILQDGFINNLNQEQKLEVINLKLNDLRKGSGTKRTSGGVCTKGVGVGSN